MSAELTSGSGRNEDVELSIRLRFGGIHFMNDSVIMGNGSGRGKDQGEGRKRVSGQLQKKEVAATEEELLGIEKTLLFFHTDYNERYLIPQSYTHEALDRHKIEEGERGRFLVFTFADRKMRSSEGTEDNGITAGGGFQLLLMTNVLNQDHQVCTKLEGTTGTLTCQKDNLKKGGVLLFKDLIFSCPSLREYYPDVSPVKGTLSWLQISIRHVSPFLFLKDSLLGSGLFSDGEQTVRTTVMDGQLMRKKRLEQDSVKAFVEQLLTPYFLDNGVCAMPKAAAFYRLIYPITTQNVGVYSAYLGHMLHLYSPNLGPHRIHYLFEAALARSPEIVDMTMWKMIMDVRFSYSDRVYLTKEDVIRAVANNYSEEEICTLVSSHMLIRNPQLPRRHRYRIVVHLWTWHQTKIYYVHFEKKFLLIL